MVVHDIDLAVPRGTILGIIGPSGAGKTTTIRMLTGRHRSRPAARSRSSVADPKRFRALDRERIGYMPQLSPVRGPDGRARTSTSSRACSGCSSGAAGGGVREVLKVVDLWDARGRRAGQLSGGMQRRLELACALVHEPDLIILDEPTAGIDPLLRGTIWEELHRLRDAGRTILVTTQHVGEAEECDAGRPDRRRHDHRDRTPDELRRSATQGDLLDIETAPFSTRRT